MSEHFIEKARACGHVVTSCRCMGPHEVRWLDGLCPQCRAHPPMQDPFAAPSAPEPERREREFELNLEAWTWELFGCDDAEKLRAKLRVILGAHARFVASPAPAVPSDPLTEEEQRALHWAEKQDYPSVSARNAKTLATALRRVLARLGRATP